MPPRIAAAAARSTSSPPLVWLNGSMQPVPLRLSLWNKELVRTPPYDRTNRTIVVTAFLKGSSAGHLGSFKSSMSHLLKHVDLFVRRSPGICSASQLHVVHDIEYYRHNASRKGVHLHYFPAVSTMPPGDARWSMFAQVLRAAERDVHGGWECAWAVDLTDVDVLRLPPCSAAYYGEAQLAIGTDACALRPAWLRDVAQRANYTARLSAPMRALIDDRSRRQIRNCGLVGGLRAVLLPAIERMSERMRRHYSEDPRPPHVPMDMLFWNEYALGWEASGRPPLVSGYPRGPVNLPMWGGLAEGTQMCEVRPAPPMSTDEH